MRALDHAGAPGPRALRRRLELGGLADRQGARHRRAARPGALRIAAGLLHHRRPRPRARAGADARERRRRPDGVEPARRRPAQRQVRPRAAGRGGQPAHRASTSRRSTRTGPTTASTPCARSPVRAACRWRRSRSPGCCTSRRSRASSSVPSGPSSSPTTSPPSRSRSSADELATARRGQPAAARIPGLDVRAPGRSPRKQLAEARRRSGAA